MTRPTLKDLAAAAGVSLATVNRAIGEPARVRPATLQRVYETAQQIGFHGAGLLKRHAAPPARQRHRLGVLMQCPHRPFAMRLVERIGEAAESESALLRHEYLDDLSPERAAERMLDMADDCQALAVLAAEHPVVSEAIEQLAARGVPVVAVVSALSSTPRAGVGYVGLDSWKVGRTAGWAFDHLCRAPGKLGLLVGTHRYRCHDLYESGIRSYLREHQRPGREFTLLEPLSTFEADAIARELTEKLLRQHPDLKGLYVSCGGVAGALTAVRQARLGPDFVMIGHDLMEPTRAGLLDRTMSFLMSHRFETIARETVALLIRSIAAGPAAPGQSVMVPFEIYTRENL